jgi:hypothetical protein
MHYNIPSLKGYDNLLKLTRVGIVVAIFEYAHKGRKLVGFKIVHRLGFSTFS